MAGPDLPEIPVPLKSIQHYLKVATTHDQRDIVISYWCRLYALQTGLKLSTKTNEETSFLLILMDWLETTKKELRDNEAITNEVAAQAHLENWALKLFLYADRNDRDSNFGKSVVQSFFTAGLLYDVLTVFGELSEEAMQNRKYAKWKAAYIHNCLKNGETPVPGPLKTDEDDAEFDKNVDQESTEPYDNSSTIPKPEQRGSALDSDELGSPKDVDADDATVDPTSGRTVQRSGSTDHSLTPRMEGGVELSLEQIGKAQKLIKWAGSALNYDDVPTAVLNLQKAIHLLTTGKEIA